MLYPTELRAHRTNDNAIKHLQPFPKLVEFRFSVRSVQLRRFSTQLKPFRPEVRNPSQPFLPLLCGTPRHAVKVQGTKKRRRTIRERREIVEETLLPGASVSRVARRHDITANQVFYWRKLYREGQLGSNADTRLVPVKVAKDRSVGIPMKSISIPL
jgi:hypothetical protein